MGEKLLTLTRQLELLTSPNPWGTKGETMPHKQTSSRISSDASSLLAKIPRGALVQVFGPPLRSGGPDLGCRKYLGDIPPAKLRSCLASLVSQDETKGQKRKPSKRKRAPKAVSK